MNCSIDKLLVMFWNLSACFRPKGLSACIPSETGEACVSFALIWCPKFLWRKFRLSMSESTEECTCVCLRLAGLLGRLQPLQVWNRNEHPYPVCSVTFWNRWGKNAFKIKAEEWKPWFFLIRWSTSHKYDSAHQGRAGNSAEITSSQTKSP